MSGKYRDFDAFFAEAHEENITFKVKGREYTIPPSPSLGAVVRLDKIRRSKGMDGALSELELEQMGIDVLGKEQFDQMIADGVTIKEFEQIFEWIWSLYRGVETSDEANDDQKNGQEAVDIIEKWGLIEADFQREYGINLVEELDALSWRRFLVLLGGLGMNSTLINVISQAKRHSEEVIEDPQVAERAIRQAWGYSSGAQGWRAVQHNIT